MTSYWERTRWPLQSLYFLLPLLVLYEFGTWWYAPAGDTRLPAIYAESLLDQFFQRFGVTGYYLPGVLVVVVLLFWHLSRRDPWRIEWPLYGLMWIESAVLALPLFVFMLVLFRAGGVGSAGGTGGPPVGGGSAAQATDEGGRSAMMDSHTHQGKYHLAQSRGCQPVGRAGELTCAAAKRVSFTFTSHRPAVGLTNAAEVASENGGTMRITGGGQAPETGIRGWRAGLVFSIGAGIYEELLFRLIAIAVLHLILVDVLALPDTWGATAAVVGSAVAFGAYHFLGPTPFDWGRFLFYAAAGVYFAAVYVLRGFGIVAATHALYDVLVVVSPLLLRGG